MEAIKSPTKPTEFKVPAVPKKNICSGCDEVFDRRSELIKHSIDHGEFICKFCDSKYPLKKLLDTHKCTFCKICKRTFKSYTGIRYHMISSHNIKPTDLLECDYCGLIFKKKPLFLKHIEKHLKAIKVKSNKRFKKA